MAHIGEESERLPSKKSLQLGALAIMVDLE